MPKMALPVRTLTEAWLRRWRTDTSHRLGVPPYFICTNKQIDALVADPPESCAELLARKGWTPKKFNRYGEAFADFMGWDVDFPLIESMPRKKRLGGRSCTLVGGSARISVKKMKSHVSESILASDLTEEQAAIATRILEGDENVFLTGAAGTGKSYLFKYLKSAMPGRVAVTASTGIAAVAIGGQTIHSWAGVGLARDPASVLMERMDPRAKRRWRTTDVLFIDEISMIDAKLYDKLAYIGACLRDVNQPFGDLRVVLCGDFFQLPPVDGLYAFQSHAWNATMLTLRVVMRCADEALIRMLTRIREGHFEVGWLTDCHIDQKPAPTDGIPPTRLYCTNHDVDAENAARLAELPGNTRVFKSTDTFTPVDPEGPEGPSRPSRRVKFRAPNTISLKVDAQVTLTRNTPPWGVNGSRGIVLSLDPLRVRFDSGYVWDCEYTLETHDGGTRAYLPLKLAWALTVHKSQGMSLTRVNVDVAKAFDYGQVYVALSRARTKEGLWLSGPPLRAGVVRAHAKVKEFYTRI